MSKKKLLTFSLPLTHSTTFSKKLMYIRNQFLGSLSLHLNHVIA